MITKAKVAHEMLNMPDESEKFTLQIWRLINSTPFDYTIMIFILLNMLQMGVQYEGQTP
jgi:hypothetical protein